MLCELYFNFLKKYNVEGTEVKVISLSDMYFSLKSFSLSLHPFHQASLLCQVLQAQVSSHFVSQEFLTLWEDPTFSNYLRDYQTTDGQIKIKSPKEQEWTMLALLENEFIQHIFTEDIYCTRNCNYKDG